LFASFKNIHFLANMKKSPGIFQKSKKKTLQKFEGSRFYINPD